MHKIKDFYDYLEEFSLPEYDDWDIQAMFEEIEEDKMNKVEKENTRMALLEKAVKQSEDTASKVEKLAIAMERLIEEVKELKHAKQSSKGSK